MTCERQCARSLHARGLDEQHFAADRGPRHADGNAGVLGALFDFLV
jgi:hypothetical protein